MIEKGMGTVGKEGREKRKERREEDGKSERNGKVGGR
jgi:hypothetical protein